MNNLAWAEMVNEKTSARRDLPIRFAELIIYLHVQQVVSRSKLYIAQ